jgi:hypothetical protein
LYENLRLLKQSFKDRIIKDKNYESEDDLWYLINKYYLLKKLDLIIFLFIKNYIKNSRIAII